MCVSSLNHKINWSQAGASKGLFLSFFFLSCVVTSVKNPVNSEVMCEGVILPLATDRTCTFEV